MHHTPTHGRQRRAPVVGIGLLEVAYLTSGAYPEGGGAPEFTPQTRAVGGRASTAGRRRRTTVAARWPSRSARYRRSTTDARRASRRRSARSQRRISAAS
jgi:hypothetical protein